ncbi:sugar transferase [Cognatishimia sp.]|uniref:sugar transferase n=1 Tax=Cognatishimia sp. TaxID=2211648 RepID=UPI003516EDF7
MKHVRADDILTPDRVVPALKTSSVMDFDLVNETSERVIETLLSPGRRKVAFMNAHCMNVATRSEDYAHALRRADYVLPDGIGIEIAAKLSNVSLKENLNGTDLGPRLMQQAALEGLRVYFLGGETGTAERAAERLRRQIPGLKIVGARDGFQGMVGAVEDINASGADILLVALGVPLQDLWIDRHFDQLNVRLALGVGALLDFWAGNVERAPSFMRRARSEWVWRLMIEPRRLAGRYLIGNLTFLTRAALFRLKSIRATDVLKRGVDLILSFAALVFLMPLFLAVTLAIRLESPGRAVFRQTRVGQNGRTFTLYKFRSMYVDAEERRAAVLAQSDRDGVCFKAKDDPRITRTGRILRRYSIDELPQILNVLLGHMSIVGPRPGLPCEVADYSDHARLRLAAKPGLTGLWQISGRADIGFDHMVEMDLAYARSRSVALDILIIGLTFRAVFSGRGAY